MIIYDAGANPAASDIPGLYIGVNSPPNTSLPGAPTDGVGIVGVASWGPKDAAIAVSSESDAAMWLGSMVDRKFDIMTHVHAAVMQGARNFRLIRRTDGTDVAASAVVQTTGVTLTSRYTGSGGNAIQAKIDIGSAASTWKVTIQKPGWAAEIFDNIPGTLNAAWVNIAAAINNGIGPQRGPSKIVVATAGASTTSPTTGGGPVTLTSGTDGNSGVTATTLVGADTTPRTGMYALRNSGVAVFLLADADDSTTFAAQIAFGLSEQAYAYMTGPSGQTVDAFVTAQAGIDNPWGKSLLGDWIYILDPSLGRTRLISPQSVAAGNKAVIGPQKSGLNKPLQGIVGTQKSMASLLYSNAELQLIAQARGDVVVMNSDGGDYPSLKFGRNTSSNRAKRGDNYTTMTNYLASSFNAKSGLGLFVGELITPEQMREAQSTIGGFLENEKTASPPRIQDYSVQVDEGNNPASQIELGIEKATVMVRYLSVIEFFLVDFTGGQTVQIVSPRESFAA